MDKISFTITEKKDNFYDIEVFLNEKKIPHSILNTFDVLAASLVNNAEFDLFTCTCGVSGCAGFQSPVKQSKNKEKVFWLFSEDYNVPYPFYSFNIKEFEETFLKLKNDIFSYHEKGFYSYSSYEYYTDDVYDKTENVTLTLDEYINPIVDNYKAISKALEFCNKQMPFLKNIAFKYNEYSDSVSASDLVFMALNEWPRAKNNNKNYYKKILNTCQAINKWIINGDFSYISEIDKNSYESVCETKPKSTLYFLNRISFHKKIEGQTKFLWLDNDFIIENGEEKPYPENFSINDIDISF